MERRPLIDGEEEAPRTGVAANKKLVIIVVTVALLVAVVAIVTPVSILVHKSSSESGSDNGHPDLTCAAANFPPSYKPFYASPPPPQASSAAGAVLLRNATLLTGLAGAGGKLTGRDLLMSGGKIVEIGVGLAKPQGAEEIQLGGAYVTPGLVDMHSHLGVYSLPTDAGATQDGNEMTNPTLPQMRALDGLDPEDMAIPAIRAGGVTTSLVLPGSGNVMGGQGAYVKLRPGSTVDMLIAGAPRALKMACGENPKRVYGSRGQMPMSRMGSGWLMRDIFFSAAQLKQLQQQWDCLNASSATVDPRPEDLSLEPLVAILNGDARLNVHCYKVEDIEMMLRLSDEFGFSISAFHHGLEAWKIAPEIAARNIAVATFADHWGFKLEAYDGSVHAPSVLQAAGANVALKSDHPVIFAQYLMLEAAKAYHYGLDELTAIQTVTLNPATAIGLSDRLGSLEPGKDADVVVWNRHPLELGAQTVQVYIDGVLVSSSNATIQPEPAVLTPATLDSQGTTACTGSVSPLYTVVNVTVYTMNSAPLTGANIVVTDGIVTCLGSADACPAVPAGDIYTLNGGVVTPGFVNVGAPLGQVEIDQEPDSSDGVASGGGESVWAVDGIHMSTYVSRHMTAAFNGGVTTSVVSPLGSNLIGGIGAAHYTTGTVIDDALISDRVSVDIHIGNDVKGTVGSVSQQISQLRTSIAASIAAGGAFAEAAAGNLTVVAHVDQADEISAVLRLQKQFGFRLAVMGGAEAYLLAPQLAAAGVSVILSPARPALGTFDTWRASSTAFSTLRGSGVRVALAVADAGEVRNLRWEAGIALTQPNVSYDDALKSVTTFPAEIFGLNSTGAGTVTKDTKANFVAFSSDPLRIQSTISLVGLGGVVKCNPQQY